MKQCIAVVSGKGGTGKTSLVAGLAAALARRNVSTLAVDCDIGLRNLDLVLGVSDRTALDFGDVLDGRATLDSALISHPQFPLLRVLAAPLRITATQERERFRAMIEGAFRIADVLLLDAPAGLGSGFHLALAPATRAIVATTPDAAALRDAARCAEMLRESHISEGHLVVGRVRPRMIERSQASNIDDAMDAVGLPLLGLVPEDERVIAQGNRGLPSTLDCRDGAARAYQNIARRLCGENIPLMKITKIY